MGTAASTAISGLPPHSQAKYLDKRQSKITVQSSFSTTVERTVSVSQSNHKQNDLTTHTSRSPTVRENNNTIMNFEDDPEIDRIPSFAKTFQLQWNEEFFTQNESIQKAFMDFLVEQTNKHNHSAMNLYTTSLETISSSFSWCPETIQQSLMKNMINKLQPLEIYDTVFADYHLLLTGGEEMPVKAAVLTQLKTRETAAAFLTGSYHTGHNNNSDQTLFHNSYLSMETMKDFFLLSYWLLFLQQPIYEKKLKEWKERQLGRRKSSWFSTSPLLLNRSNKPSNKNNSSRETNNDSSSLENSEASYKNIRTMSNKDIKDGSSSSSEEKWNNKEMGTITAAGSPVLSSSPSSSPCQSPVSEIIKNNNSSSKSTPVAVVALSSVATAAPLPARDTLASTKTPFQHHLTGTDSPLMHSCKKENDFPYFNKNKLSKIDIERITAICVHFDRVSSIFLSSFTQEFQQYYSKSQWLSKNRLFQVLNELPVPLAILSVPSFDYSNSNKNSSTDNFPFVYCNKHFEMLTKYRYGELYQEKQYFPKCLVHSSTEKGQLDKLNHSLAHGISLKLAITMKRKDNSSFYNFLSLSPIHSLQGDYKFVIVKGYDTYKSGANLKEIKCCEEILFILSMILKAC
jgi:hypothetical protein